MPDDFLGDLTNEINPKEGNFIETFVSGGPKNYAYRLDTGKTCCNVRGFTLNFRNSQLINFDSVVDMVKGVGPETIRISDPRKIVRNGKTKEILTKSSTKDYRVVYSRRVVQDDYNTVPYGYNPL